MGLGDFRQDVPESHKKRCVDWYSCGFISAVKNGTGREDFDALA
jgi:hypothetical protein